MFHYIKKLVNEFKRRLKTNRRLRVENRRLKDKVEYIEEQYYAYRRDLRFVKDTLTQAMEGSWKGRAELKFGDTLNWLSTVDRVDPQDLMQWIERVRAAGFNLANVRFVHPIVGLEEETNGRTRKKARRTESTEKRSTG